MIARIAETSRGASLGRRLRCVVVLAGLGAITLGDQALGQTATPSLAAAGPNARLAGFARRQASGRGSYFTRADIERVNPTSFSQFLRMVPSRVRVVDLGGSLVAISQRGNKPVWDADAGRLREAPCVARIMVDGRMEPQGASLDDVDPGSIAALEVYDGSASIPAELSRGQRDEACGLIVVWTRAG